MSDSVQASEGRRPVNPAVEAAIRLGLLFVLAAWCFLIVEPFIIPILWGMIIAIACFPMYRWMQQKLGGRGKLAATLFTLLALAVLITPTVMLVDTVADTTQHLSRGLQEGSLTVPPPPAFHHSPDHVAAAAASASDSKGRDGSPGTV